MIAIAAPPEYIKDTMNPITLELLKNAFTAVPEEKLVGYAVNRAQHADVGGMTPGSGSSTELFQEGLIIPRANC